MVGRTERGGTPFVGRRPQMEALVARLARAGGGRGGIALVGGEPGVGKTRLVLEFADRARAGGWRVLVGRAAEPAGTPPYLAFADALRDDVLACPIGELRARLGSGAAAVALVVPELRARLPDLAAEPPASPRDRARLYAAIVDYVLAGARGRSPGGGLLLVLDDLQWADAESLLLLRHLARRLEGVPALVAATFRSVGLGRGHPLADLLADFDREHRAEYHPLDPFSPEETAAFVAAIGDAPIASEVIGAIHRETEGNPFFIEEVVRGLRSTGRGPATPVDAAAADVPERVRRAIGQRLARLGPETNRLVETASVLGPGFAVEVLEASTGLAVDRLADALDEAIDAGILREEGDRWRFGHDLIRQTVYGGLNGVRRRHLHRQVGEALERHAADDPAPYLTEIAHHFAAAATSRREEIERAVAYARRAGDRSMRLFAYEAGARLYDLAARTLARAAEPDATRRAELLLDRGDAERKAGDLHRAMTTFGEVATLACGADAPGLLARAALGYEDAVLATGLPRSGSEDDSVRLQEEALGGLGTGDTPLRARLLAALSQALYFAGAVKRAAALSGEAVVVARRLDDQVALAGALRARRIVVWGPDVLAERLAVATELADVATAAGDRELALEGRLWRLRALLERGDVVGAEAEIAACARLAAALRQPHHGAEVAAWRAAMALLAGRFDEAERMGAEALALGQRAQSEDAELYVVAQRFASWRLRGRLDKLAELEPTIAGFAERYAAMPGWWAVLAVLRAEIGRDGDARAAFARATARDAADLVRGPLWLHTVGLLAEAAVMLGEASSAARLYDLLLPYADRTIVEACCHGSVARYLGLLAGALRRWEAADGHFTAALRANAALGAPALVASTQQAGAAMLLARRWRGDAARARRLLDLAATTSRALGAEPAAVRAEALRDRRAPSAVPVVTNRPAGLTPREAEVLRLIASGRSNREIAATLFLSVRTVERHITNLYGKIDARGKADATAFAFAHDLAPPPGP